MVECGSMEQTPDINNLTVWGIVTFVIMLVLGILSIGGVIEAVNYMSFWGILCLVGSGFGVAGLIFVILALVQKNPAHMKIGTLCFLISCIIHTVLLIIAICAGKHIYISSILQLCLDIFLCYLFYVQSKNLGPSASAPSSK